MSETVDAPVQISAEQTQQFNPFSQQSWTDQVPTSTLKTTNTTEPVTTTTAVPQPKNEAPPAVANEWYKDYGWENAEAAKTEIETLKGLKVNPPQPEPFKYANEDSEKVHKLLMEGKVDDVVAVYNKQKNIDRAISLDVSNETAAEIIKLNMGLKYPTLTADQINFQYKQEYGIPKEPIWDKVKEDEDDFNERYNEWEEQVANVHMKAQIAATMAKPELEKAKTQIVLPDIKQSVPNEANQPDPEALKKLRENFLNKLESDFSKAEGFSTTVKDESVELPVSFKIPDDSKAAIKGRLAGDFNVEDFITNRWFPQGEPKVEQIVSDLYQLENLDKIISGVANNAANERLKEYRKQTSNINVNGSTAQQTYQQQNGANSFTPFSKDSWSEKPPIPQTV